MKQERTEENKGRIGSQLETIFRVTLLAALEDELPPHNRIFFIFFLLYWVFVVAHRLSCRMWDLGSPTRDQTLGSLHWEQGVLSIGWPRKSCRS